MSGKQRILLLGYGNPGRCDDGLGPALTEAVEKMRIPGVVVDSDYQLVVEDAHTIAGYDVVIFADADATGPEPFSFRRIEPTGDKIGGFSSHSVSPAEVLALAREMFSAKTTAYVLGIRGYMFEEFGERFSNKAKENLAAATTFIERVLRSGDFAEFPDRTTDNKQAGS
jgi:hydrogenase maturation protease